MFKNLYKEVTPKPQNIIIHLYLINKNYASDKVCGLNISLHKDQFYSTIIRIILFCFVGIKKCNFSWVIKHAKLLLRFLKRRVIIGLLLPLDFKIYEKISN